MMALPPVWLAVEEVFETYRDTADDSSIIAQSMVKALEAKGLRIVPAYAVDEERLLVGLGLGHRITDDERAEMAEHAALTDDPAAFDEPEPRIEWTVRFPDEALDDLMPQSEASARRDAAMFDDKGAVVMTRQAAPPPGPWTEERRG